MKETKIINVGTVMTGFEIRDAENALIGSFQINLQDESLISRLQDFRAYFFGYKPKSTGREKRRELDDAAQEAFCRLFGSDVRQSLFSVLKPTTILENGETFAGVILKTVADAFIENAREKLKASIRAMNRYTEKYDNERV